MLATIVEGTAAAKGELSNQGGPDAAGPAVEGTAANLDTIDEHFFADPMGETHPSNPNFSKKRRSSQKEKFSYVFICLSDVCCDLGC